MSDGDDETPAETPDETEETPEDAHEETSEAESDETESEPDEEVEETEEAEADGEAEEAEEAEETEETDSESESEEETESDSEGETEAEETEEEAEETDLESPTAEKLNERLDDAEEDLEAAETEDDLDDVEAKLDDIESDIEAADLPEPDEDAEEDDEEEVEDPRAELEARLSDLREDLESQRGPYAEDVVEDIESAKTKITDTRWTERGQGEIVEVVESFTADVNEILGTSVSVDGEAEENLTVALDEAGDAVESAGLDADEDEETIAELLEATDELEAGLEDAQEWDDLQTNEKLRAEGFFDVLGHYKDFPPELSAVLEWEQRGRADMIMLAKDNLQSEFMQAHCMDAFVRMGDPSVFDEMHQLAERRNKKAIRALGTMGSGADDAVETLTEYVDADSDPALQKVTFKALGEIGSPAATQAVADKLVMDNDNVRPYAARSLGLIGDTRAVKPLKDTLANDDNDTVRAAAAWALRQIGTKEALEATAEYSDERSFLVQHEADRANDSLGDTDAPRA
ncbi:HEAT repeat domain-containing protein [Halogeometricum luteum]|uniref:HEAT repeat domain-containing protein n=1 Tax=Halogeometricum luteum TaxID=2950537 RepID=A0ABU2FXK2_9EURY|nr:HEAT repeat domain-containing protein [Halogeometricum sp. S3BR5-2]MDS0293262.1 HEAT repeat domain-containing protein [Halogeometricum sp. S3BR5-2]